MRWTELGIGAAITLAVTVVGGLTVHLLTREESKESELVYTAQQISGFSSSTRELGIYAIKLKNIGNTIARSVEVGASFPAENVTESSVESDLELISDFKITYDVDNTVNIDIPAVYPNEIVTVSFLLDGEVVFDPTIQVRSIDALGQLVDSLEQENDSFLDDYYVIIIALVAGSSQAIFAFIIAAQRYSKRIMATTSNINNTAFLLIAKGDVELAIETLHEGRKRNGLGFFEFLNLGTALSINDQCFYHKYIDIAYWMANGKYHRCLIAYSKATILYSMNRFDEALEYAKVAAESRLVFSYLNLNEYFLKALDQHDGSSQFWQENDIGSYRLGGKVVSANSEGLS